MARKRLAFGLIAGLFSTSALAQGTVPQGPVYWQQLSGGIFSSFNFMNGPVTRVVPSSQGSANPNIPLTTTQGLFPGMAVSGGGLPAATYVQYVTGGVNAQSYTALFNFTAQNPAITSWLPLNSVSGIFVGMVAQDGGGSLAPNATVGAVYGQGFSPVQLTGLTTTTGGTSFPATNAASCPINTWVYDTTLPSGIGGGYGDFVVGNSGGNITTLTGLGTISSTDVVKCFPVVGFDPGGIASNITASDTLTFYPSVAVSQSPANPIPGTTTLTFNQGQIVGPNGTTMTSPLSISSAGIYQNGSPVFYIGGGTNYQNEPGSVTLVGLGAGSNVPPGEGILTAVGFDALHSLRVPNAESTAFGWQAGKLLQSGTFVNLFGINALGSCVAGCYSLMAFGTDAMRNTTNANSDVALGTDSMINNNAINSVDIGGNQQGAGGTIATGISNTSVGMGAMKGLNMTTASQNTAVGINALGSLTTGQFNVGLGSNAGRLITTDTRNVYIGDGAGFNAAGGTGENVVVGQFSGFNISTGSNNVILGQAEGNTLTTGSGNLVIGTSDFPSDVPSATASHQLNIGNLLTGFINNGSSTQLTVNAPLTETFGGGSLTLSNHSLFAGGTDFEIFGNQTNGVAFSVVNSSATAASHVEIDAGTSTNPPLISSAPVATDLNFNRPINFNAFADAGSGSSYQVPAGVDTVRLSSVTSPFTLTTPATAPGSLTGGHMLWIICKVNVASLTVAASTGQVINSSPTSCPVGTGHLLRYDGLGWDKYF